MNRGLANKFHGWGQGSSRHIISRSIGGPDILGNIYRWTKKKHQAYHQLFYNYLPSIVIKIIEEWTDGQGELNKEKMGLRNFKAWRRVFKKQEPAQAIEFIEREFLPLERKFLRGELKRRRNGRKG